MVTVPAVIPVTLPDPSTLTTAMLLLLQVPPATSSVSDVVAPAHIVVEPVIGSAAGFIVTITVAGGQDPTE